VINELNFSSWHEARNVACVQANLRNEPVVIFKPFNHDSYSLAIGEIPAKAAYDSENVVELINPRK
jgi:hypothetical protein